MVLPDNTRSTIPPTTVHAQITTPPAIDPGCRHARATIVPTAVPARNGQAVCQIPAGSADSPWLIVPMTAKTDTAPTSIALAQNFTPEHYADDMTEQVPKRRARDRSERPSPVRVMGIETEYGISALGSRGEEDLHPMQLSNHVVKAYGGQRRRRATSRPAGWDYETETPLRDSRGYEVTRSQAHPDQLTDADLGMANLILTNGARLYVDHAHPEYSGPEVTGALDAVRFDKAGDAIMALAAQRASVSLGRSVRLYKNNTDGKGASYGTHENYLLDRSRRSTGWSPSSARSSSLGR